MKGKIHKKDYVTSSRGFTLVELMIVIAIIAVLATIATLATDAFLPRYRLNSACLDIISAFQRARVSAIRNNDGTAAGVSPQCVLVFQPAGTAGALPGGSYYVFMDTNANWVEDAGEARVIPQKEMPAGVILSNANFINNNSGQPNATFCCAYNTQGMAASISGGGTIVSGNVHIQTVDGSRTIRLNFTVTGRVNKQIRDSGGTWRDYN